MMKMIEDMLYHAMNNEILHLKIYYDRRK